MITTSPTYHGIHDTFEFTLHSCYVSADEFMGFNNKPCSASDKDKTSSCGPYLRDDKDGGDQWKTWTISVRNKLSDGSYIVQIANYYSSPKTKPK